MKATIVFKNGKYYALTETSFIELICTDLLTQLIPDDIIEIENNKVLTLISRKVPQITVAIVRGFHSGNAYLFCPLFGNIFNPKVVDHTLKIGDRVLLEITESTYSILKNYGSIHNRARDFEIINDINVASYRLLPVDLEVGEHSYTQTYRDLTHLNTFNIDPAESKDFDDAITCDGNRIYIHIVDINYYISHNSTEDLKGREGAFTLYLSEGNTNIIDRKLAENDYSLILGKERRVITVEMLINDKLEIEDYDIYPSTIIIKNRYNYDDAPEMPFLASLAASMKRHHFNIPQLKLTIGSDGKLVGCSHLYSTDINHRIIETLMVMTNILISKHLRGCCTDYNLIPQRFHAKLKSLPEGEPIVSDEIVNSFLAIKSFALASYEIEKSGHFGLGTSTYTHFTSPIRRYFDVIIHRMLGGWSYKKEQLCSLLHYINERERLIESLQRLYKTWKIYDILKSGDKWKVFITKIVPSGIYYLHKKYMIDGFVHVSRIGSGIHLSFVDRKLVGGGLEIAVGQEVDCVIDKVDLMTSTIGLSISA